MKPLTDLELANNLGISLTELLKRREERRRRLVDPAADAYRKAFADALIRRKGIGLNGDTK